ncbi:helix-turn-helix transcriptional regulator [Companilactobacillus musae]|uniref:helix-turn-helix transcriptional regulator n=1 Tax=Companilactobacillus musae TaxID=1903258 RepID=UPI003530D100
MIKNNVRKFRQEHKYSQKQLAEMVHVSRQTIISVESGRYQPTLELSFKLARAFEKTVEEVFIYYE